MPNNVRHINPPELSKPFGYTHVVEVTGKLAFISGQVPFDKEGQLVGPGDLKAQTEQVFQNLKAALASLGADFTNIVKITFYVRDATERLTIREVRAQYLPKENPPASTFIEVSSLVLPELLIEIDAVVAVP
jgi:enamine deaminase RidA (YjgF/YER057c/UK114 family)